MEENDNIEMSDEEVPFKHEFEDEEEDLDEEE